MNEILANLKETLEKKVSEGKQLGKTTRGIKGDVLEELKNYTIFLDNIYSEVRVIDRVICLLEGIDSENKLPKCKYCGEDYCLFSKKKDQYFAEVCSQKCGIKYGGTKNSDPEVAKRAAEKRKNTYKDRYGVDHISQLDEIKQQKHETAMSNYGSLKAAYHDTMVKTLKDKYGVYNISELDEIKLRKIKTSRQNWGTDYPWQSDEGKKLQKEGVYEKYGVYNISQLEEIKRKKEEQSLRNYNTRNVSQSLEVRRKILESNGVEYKTPSGNIILCDGFESKILDLIYGLFPEEVIKPQPEMSIEYKENNKTRVWFPDCIIGEYIVEFKELLTCFLYEGNIINKLIATNKKGYKTFLIVGDYNNNEYVKLELLYDINNDSIMWELNKLTDKADTCINVLTEKFTNKILING